MIKSVLTCIIRISVGINLRCTLWLILFSTGYLWSAKCFHYWFSASLTPDSDDLLLFSGEFELYALSFNYLDKLPSAV